MEHGRNTYEYVVYRDTLGEAETQAVNEARSEGIRKPRVESSTILSDESGFRVVVSGFDPMTKNEEAGRAKDEELATRVPDPERRVLVHALDIAAFPPERDKAARGEVPWPYIWALRTALEAMGAEWRHVKLEKESRS